MTNNILLAKKNQLVMVCLVSIFMAYNIAVYTQVSSNNKLKMSKKALVGEQLYQDNNCTSCHQFFGLGGYLGPDLTNIISNKSKGRDYVKSFLNSGVKSMPKFTFTENEKEALIEFLTEVDQCGYYPISNATKKATGWVEIQYKNQ